MGKYIKQNFYKERENIAIDVIEKKWSNGEDWENNTEGLKEEIAPKRRNSRLYKFLEGDIGGGMCIENDITKHEIEKEIRNLKRKTSRVL